jgi:pimeloyl-ACP methyl ester carboxylesterase
MHTTLLHPTRRWPPAPLPALLGLVLAIALGVAACSVAPATRADTDQPGSPSRGRLVDVGGRHLHLECEGSGTPSVVFVAGLGDSGATSWRTVWGQAARSTRACIYDRAGLGRSDPEPKAATYRSAADDLHALLRAGRVPGPYVLVGHSLGGLIARLYAHRHPAEVAGMVLLDGTLVDWFQTLQRLLPDVLIAPLAHNPEGFDLTDGLASLTPLDAPGALGRRPLAVMWAPNQPPPGLPASTVRELERVWEAGQARLEGLSSASRLQRLAASGHHLQRDQPDLVVASINEVLGALRPAEGR